MELTRWFKNKLIKFLWEEFVPLYEKYNPKDCISSNNQLEGKYLVNFKKPTFNYKDVIIMGNDLLPADVIPYKGRLKIKWYNGNSCVVDHKFCNFKQIKENAEG